MAHRGSRIAGAAGSKPPIFPGPGIHLEQLLPHYSEPRRCPGRNIRRPRSRPDGTLRRGPNLQGRLTLSTRGVAASAGSGLDRDQRIPGRRARGRPDGRPTRSHPGIAQGHAVRGAPRIGRAAPGAPARREAPGERALIASAVTETEQMFDQVSREFRVGMTAREIAALFHREADRAGRPTAWSRRHCPTVTVGAKSPVGHVRPGNEPVHRDCVIHVDFGIVRDSYCSDLQRLWYAAADGERVAPDAVRSAYAAIVESIDLAAKARLPGVAGWEVDQKVRDHLKSLGYPEYAHALGHHLGRAVHDGGGVLGPRWERYGNAPYETVREGSVYTLEPSIHLPAHGLVSLEEDVVVGPQGAEFLSRFPRELPILTLR